MEPGSDVDEGRWFNCGSRLGERDEKAQAKFVKFFTSVRFAPFEVPGQHSRGARSLERRRADAQGFLFLKVSPSKSAGPPLNPFLGAERKRGRSDLKGEVEFFP